MKKYSIDQFNRQIEAGTERCHELEKIIEDARAELDARRKEADTAKQRGDVKRFQELKDSADKIERQINDQSEVVEAMRKQKCVNEADVVTAWNQYAGEYNKEARKLIEAFDKTFATLCKDFLAIAALQVDGLRNQADTKQLIDLYCLRDPDTPELVPIDVKTVPGGLANAIIRASTQRQDYWLSEVMIAGEPVEKELMLDFSDPDYPWSWLMRGAETLQKRRV